MPERPHRDLLVVGGTGFLGRHVLAIATGVVVATRNRSPVPPSDPKVDWHRCNLADGGRAVGELIRAIRPRAVVNAAYRQGGGDLDAVTAEAPGAMAAACCEIGARFVHLSTDVVFDGTTAGAYREGDPPSPVHDYGRAKARAEQLVARHDPRAVIVRTSLLWGGRDDPGPQVLLTTDPSITFFDDELRSPLGVDALAGACLELTERDEISGLLHVAGADTVDRLEFAKRISLLVGVDPRSLRGGPSPVGESRPRNCSLDTTRARALLTTDLPGIRQEHP